MESSKSWLYASTEGVYWLGICESVYGVLGVAGGGYSILIADHSNRATITESKALGQRQRICDEPTIKFQKGWW